MQRHQTTTHFSGFGKDTLFEISSDFNGCGHWVQASKLSVDYPKGSPVETTSVTMQQVGDKTYMLFESLPAELKIDKARILVKPAELFHVGILLNPELSLTGNSIIEMSDGHIFKQIDGKHLKMSDDPFETLSTVVRLEEHFLLRIWGLRQTIRMCSLVDLAWSKSNIFIQEARKLLPQGTSFPKNAKDIFLDMLLSLCRHQKIKVRTTCDIAFDTIINDVNSIPIFPATGWQQVAEESCYRHPDRLLCIEGVIGCEQLSLAETFVRRISNPDLKEVCFRGAVSQFTVRRFEDDIRGSLERAYHSDPMYKALLEDKRVTGRLICPELSTQTEQAAN